MTLWTDVSAFKKSSTSVIALVKKSTAQVKTIKCKHVLFTYLIFVFYLIGVWFEASVGTQMMSQVERMPDSITKGTVNLFVYIPQLKLQRIAWAGVK